MNPHFFLMISSVYKDRLKRLKSMHSDFSRLPAEFQARVLEPRFGLGLSVSKGTRNALYAHTREFSDALLFKAALCHFKALAEGGRLSEGLMCSLVRDDRLWLEGGEDEILGCVQAWIRKNPSGGHALLQCIRVDRLPLAKRRQLVDVQNATNRARAGFMWSDYAFPGPEPSWSEYSSGQHGPSQLFVTSEIPARVLDGLFQVGHFVCAQIHDPNSYLYMWDTETDQQKSLVTPNFLRAAQLFTTMGNLVIGCIIGKEVQLRVWDLNIPHELVMRIDVKDNTRPTCLAACYPYIALGTQTGYVHVWDILKCEHVAKVAVHGRGVRALLFWEGCIISGSYEGSIGVYNIEQKSLLMPLQAANGVNALLIAGGNLYSAHNDGFVRAWTLGTWTPLPGLQIPNASKCTCLALSGSKLLCGCELQKEKGLFVVINMQSLQVEHTVALSEPPRDLLCVSGKVFCTLRDCYVILFE